MNKMRIHEGICVYTHTSVYINVYAYIHITAATVKWATVNAAVSARLFAKRHVVFFTTCITPASLSYTRGHMGYMELRSCYL